MRWPRAGILGGVIGLVLLGAGWGLAAGSSTGTEPKHTAQVLGLRPPAPLLGELQRYLAQPRTPRGVPVPPRPPAPRVLRSPNQTTCPVAAGGFCSLQPCVVFAGQATASVIIAGPQAVVRQRRGAAATTCRGNSVPRTVPASDF